MQNFAWRVFWQDNLISSTFLHNRQWLAKWDFQTFQQSDRFLLDICGQFILFTLWVQAVNILTPLTFTVPEPEAPHLSHCSTHFMCNNSRYHGTQTLSGILFSLSFHSYSLPSCFQHPKQHIWSPNLERHVVRDRKIEDLTALHVEQWG